MVLRVSAVADLDQRPSAAEATRSRADAGDAEEAWLLEAWEERRVLLAMVTVSVVATGRDGDELSAERVIEGVWLERDAPPTVEAEVADVAPSALHALGDELRGRGADIDDADLEAGFLHIELGERLRDALAEA